MTKFQPFRGMYAAFSERFLSNGSGFDKIPAVSGLVRGLLRAFFVKRFYITPTELALFSIFATSTI